MNIWFIHALFDPLYCKVVPQHINKFISYALVPQQLLYSPLFCNVVPQHINEFVLYAVVPQHALLSPHVEQLAQSENSLIKKVKSNRNRCFIVMIFSIVIMSRKMFVSKY
jgi:cyclophilin family peptidyl-prolyl cis-trans isomerase